MSNVIEISQNKIVIVDDEDFEIVNKLTWSYMKSKRKLRDTGYAAHHWKHSNKSDMKGKGGVIYMHRYILEIHGNNINGLDVDHIDKNGLNNQKHNLRIATKKQNARNSTIACNNTTGYKGVFIRTDRNIIISKIFVDGKFIYLGSFPTKEDAARAYNEAAKKYFGEFACLNEIPNV